MKQSLVATLATGIVALAATALLGGCGGASESADTVVEIAVTSPLSPNTSPVTSEDTVDSTPITEPDAPTPSTEPAPTTSERPAAPRPYASMALTPAEAGSNPLLSWDAVDGATLYRLVVLDPDGEPYWAWSGTATSVNVGGNEAETTVGARIYADMTWQVSAYDDAGVPIAFSDVGRLSP